MTTTTLPPEIARKTTDLGHGELTQVANSYTPTWECCRCSAQIRLTTTQGWTGWATEYACERVHETR